MKKEIDVITRRIRKVRYWNHIIGQMFVPNGMNQFGDVRHKGIHEKDYIYGKKGTEFETWLLKGTQSFQEMDYIGIVDLKAKDVYEGDIIAIRYDDAKEEAGYAEFHYIVVFVGGSYGYFGETTGEFMPFEDENPEEFEVIGNIFQVPANYKASKWQ